MRARTSADVRPSRGVQGIRAHGLLFSAGDALHLMAAACAPTAVLTLRARWLASATADGPAGASSSGSCARRNTPISARALRSRAARSCARRRRRRAAHAAGFGAGEPCGAQVGTQPRRVRAREVLSRSIARVKQRSKAAAAAGLARPCRDHAALRGAAQRTRTHLCSLGDPCSLRTARHGRLRRRCAASTSQRCGRCSKGSALARSSGLARRAKNRRGEVLRRGRGRPRRGRLVVRVRPLLASRRQRRWEAVQRVAPVGDRGGGGGRAGEEGGEQLGYLSGGQGRSRNYSCGCIMRV